MGSLNLEVREVIETSHLGQSAPTSLTLYTMSDCRSLNPLTSAAAENLSDDYWTRHAHTQLTISNVYCFLALNVALF